MATAQKNQVCPVCGQVIEKGEAVQQHPTLKRWTHPACVQAKTNKNTKEEIDMSNNNEPQGLGALLEALQPQQRGMLSAAPTEAEQKQVEVQTHQATLVRSLQIIIESLPYVHPDWLLQNMDDLNPELKDIARLQFVSNAVASIDRVLRLQDFLIAYQEKIMKDAGAEIPQSSQEQFKLDSVLKDLAERIGTTQRK